MAKKQVPAVDALATEVVEEFHVANEDVSYEDVTGKDDLPEGVVDLADDEPVKPVRAVKPAKVEADELPEELKGKTPAQLAKMYKDAQSVIGRQGSELGELRRTADAYIRTHLASKKEDKPAPEKAPDAVDFFADPTGSITKAIESHPALKELQGVTKDFAAREFRRQQVDAEREFTKNHPDASVVLADQAFRDWILRSPVRQAMLLRAHKHYDLDAANEIFNSWKELQAARKPAVTTLEPKEVKTVATKQAARVPTGGNAAPQAGNKGEKIYRRADIIRLMENDPDRYQMMSDEITKAYTEGRVR